MKNFRSLLPMNLQYFAEPGDPSGGGGQEPPAITVDAVKTFLESNQEGQQLLSSLNQSAADKQLESWKTNNLEKIKQEAVKSYEDAKKNKTPEQLRIEKLEKQVKDAEDSRLLSENKALVSEQVATLKLDDDLKETVSSFMLGNLVSKDTEATNKAVEAFSGVLSKINEVHADQMKEKGMQQAFGGNKGGTQPPGNDSTDPKDLLGQQLEQLLGG